MKKFSAVASVIGREVDELRVNGLAGTTQEVIERIEEFKDKGCERFYLQILDDRDLEHLILRQKFSRLNKDQIS